MVADSKGPGFLYADAVADALAISSSSSDALESAEGGGGGAAAAADSWPGRGGGGGGASSQSAVFMPEKKEMDEAGTASVVRGSFDAEAPMIWNVLLLETRLLSPISILNDRW